MKFLILGVTGMAGHVISIYLKEKGHDVVGFSRRRISYVNSICGDAKNIDLLKKIVDKGDFDYIINAIGILNEDADLHKSDAIFLNSYLPHFLADYIKNKKTCLIQMSTDCVFAGNSGPYIETSFKDGTSFYDRTKALGELNDSKNITFRNSIVGPDINPKGIGLFNWFMKQTSEINGYTKAMWTGVTTIELAKAIEIATMTKFHGLVNLVNDSNISKYELLKLFNHYMREDKIKIRPDEKFVLDKTLVRTNFDFEYKVPSYEAMIFEMKKWMEEHKELYAHYYKE